MLTQYIRVLKGDESEKAVDFSMENAERSGITTDKKYLYIAQKFPFNNIFFLMKILNTENCKIKVEYWNNANEWIEAKDVLDFTRGFKKSGLVQFSLDTDHSWDQASDADEDDNSCPDEVKGSYISDSYWLRVSFVGTLKNIQDEIETDVEIKRITYGFTTTDTINDIDKAAPKYYATFSKTKNDWLDEILIGSEMMVSEMKSSGLIISNGQIILLDDFYIPCANRVLMHIYAQMGASYDGRRGESTAAYKNFMKGNKTIDKNMNARAEKVETLASQPRLRR